ncbi:MAG: hypothetical protein Ct9H90mP8_0510 [Pseudomonadota bacterium]|nr:MAG: hypothetical protein Ct9H90mP8_0510 [Pseudomonadota bacterium]
MSPNPILGTLMKCQNPEIQTDDCPFSFDYRIEKNFSLDGQEEKETSQFKRGKRLLLAVELRIPKLFQNF